VPYSSSVSAACTSLPHSASAAAARSRGKPMASSCASAAASATGSGGADGAGPARAARVPDRQAPGDSSANAPMTRSQTRCCAGWVPNAHAILSGRASTGTASAPGCHRSGVL